jgi:hypothetical protein
LTLRFAITIDEFRRRRTKMLTNWAAIWQPSATGKQSIDHYHEHFPDRL